MKLSAVIITKNEEKNIESCIRSLGFADEIIVIDNYSSDQTAEIAVKLKARVFKLNGLDFSTLRNLGRVKAKGEWLLYLDADERVSRKLSGEIIEKIGKNDVVCAYEIPRVNYYFGKIWPYVENMTRLIRKNKLIGWRGSLHETPVFRGRIGYLEAPILHYTHTDLRSMVDKTNEWSEIEAQLRLLKNHPKVSWWRFFRVMLTAFWQSFIRQGGWRTGNRGIIESIYQSFSIFITYAKLWEKQNKSTN